MLKRRTIAMLVAGTLVGAQAGIAANENDSTAIDTYYLVPTEQVVVIESTDQLFVMVPTLSEADAGGSASEYAIGEQAFPVIYLAANEPKHDMSAEAKRAARDSNADARKTVRTMAPHSAPIEMTFKGHPASASETAGLNFPTGSQSFGHQPNRDFRAAGSFPMNSSETAGISAQTVESMRLAQQGPSGYQVILLVPTTHVAIVE